MMKPAFYFAAIIFVGALFILPKLKVPGHANYSALSPSISLNAQADFQKRGYVTLASQLQNGFGIVKDQCLAWVALSQANGENDSILAREYGTTGTLYYVYNGLTYVSRPAVRIFFDRAIARGLSIIGISETLSAVFVVVRGEECNEINRQEINAILDLKRNEI